MALIGAIVVIIVITLFVIAVKNPDLYNNIIDKLMGHPIPHRH